MTALSAPWPTSGLTVSHQTVGNILKRHGIAPAPERKTTHDVEGVYPHAHGHPRRDRLLHRRGLDIGRAGNLLRAVLYPPWQPESPGGPVTPHPNEAWMVQVARDVTMEEWGFLSPGQYLIHDRDGKYFPAFQHIIEAAGVTQVSLPPRPPNLNAYAERWVAP